MGTHLADFLCRGSNYPPVLRRFAMLTTSVQETQALHCFFLPPC